MSAIQWRQIRTMPIERSSGTDLELQCLFPVQMKVILDLYSLDRAVVVVEIVPAMTFSVECYW